MFVVFDPNGVSRPYSIQAKSPSSAVPKVPGVEAISSVQATDPHPQRRAPNPYQKLDIEQTAKPLLYARDLMSSPVITLKNTDTIADAQSIFHHKRYRHIPIVNAESKIVGILSDRDLLKYVSVSQVEVFPRDVSKDTISLVMKTNVLSAAPEASIHTIAKVMFEEHIGALPIVNEQFDLLGLVTRSDILRGLLRRGPIELWG